MDTLTAESLKHSNALLDATKESETVALGARLRRLLSLRWPVLRDTLRLVHAMLLKLGHEARIADKFAPLISGYVALTSPNVPNAKELARIIELMELAIPQKEVAERDADVCLSTLLGRKIAVFTVLAGEKTKSHMTIREVISRVIHGNATERLPLTLQLEQFGVRPMWVKGDTCWKLVVCSSEQHEGMRRLMQRTDWALGGWKDVLMRLPGAEACVHKVAKVAQRVVVVDMPQELIVPSVQEVYDFPELCGDEQAH